MVSKSGPFLFGHLVHTSISLGMKGVSEWVRVPHWLENGLVIQLYGFGDFSPHELASWVELGSSVISLRYKAVALTCQKEIFTHQFLCSIFSSHVRDHFIRCS